VPDVRAGRRLARADGSRRDANGKNRGAGNRAAGGPGGEAPSVWGYGGYPRVNTVMQR